MINNAGFECELNNCYEKRYDFDLSVNMDGMKFTIESKFDIYSAKSNNLAIEIYNTKSKCPSGIYSTLADIWVHLVPGKEDKEILAYAVHTEKLKCFIEGTKPLKSIKSGGNCNSNMQIYKMETILPIFQRFDHIKDGPTLKALFAEELQCEV